MNDTNDMNDTEVLFDVDGTPVDSNGAHADSWAQALVEHGISVTAADVRPLVGMGGGRAGTLRCAAEFHRDDRRRLTGSDP